MKQIFFSLIIITIYLNSCKKNNTQPYYTIPGKITNILGKASDIAIGADSSVFVIGTDSVSPTGGNSISKLVNGTLQKMPFSAGIRIAVSPQGIPWVVNKSNLFYKYAGYYWTPLPGSGTDIGIGADGSVFAIGDILVSSTGGYNVMKWNGFGWDQIPNGAGIRIAVSPQGIPWIVDKSNNVFKYDGISTWKIVPGVKAIDIGIGGDGSVFVTGISVSGNLITYPIYKYVNNSWVTVKDVKGTNIAVSPKGFPFWVDSQFNIYTSGY